MASIVVSGDTSGAITLQAPAVAGSTTLNLPASSGTVLTQNSSAPANSFVVDASGNVGIGTSSPSAGYRLSLTGGVGLNIQNTGANDNSVVKYSNSGKNWYAGLRGDTSNVWALADDSAFRLVVDGSGNVLVGTTTSPAGATPTLIGGLFNPNTNFGISLRPSVNVGAVMIAFYNSSGTSVGSIQSTASATSYNTSSDYRLKENIVPMTGALDTVAQLNPVTYTWKVDGSEGQGFIAHELQAVVPDCVTGEKDAVDADGNPIYQGVDTSFLVATLTKAIQELKAIVDEQAEKIKALEAK